MGIWNRVGNQVYKDLRAEGLSHAQALAVRGARGVHTAVLADIAQLAAMGPAAQDAAGNIRERRDGEEELRQRTHAVTSALRRSNRSDVGR